MRKLILTILILLVAAPGWCVDYYVREDTSHNVTRDGLTYATAWGGWSEITWGAGAGNVSASDTLYLCGSHSYSALISTGASGAGSGTETTIDGNYPSDPGTITFTGGYFNLAQRNYFNYKNLIVNAVATGFYGGGDLTDISFDNVYVVGGTMGLNLTATDGNDKTNISFTNGGMSGQTNAGITWFPLSSITCATNNPTLTGLTVTGNTFSDHAAVTNGVIHIRTEAHASCVPVVSDLNVSNNIFTTPPTTVPAIRVFDGNGDDDGDYYWGGGAVVDENTCTGGFGCIGIGGFDSSGWGPNSVSNNTVSDTIGDTGGIVSFWNKYITIVGNTINGGSTTNIDGNGIDVDRGNANVRVRRNEINRMVGKAGVHNSGSGVMVLDSQNVEVSNNRGTGNKCGLFMGDTGNLAIYSINFNNNTFIENVDFGVYISNGLDATDIAEITYRNNILTGDGSATGLNDQSTGGADADWDYGLLYDFSTNYTNHAAGAHDVTSNPLLNTNGSLTSPSPAINAGTTAFAVGLHGEQTDASGNTDIFAKTYRLNIGADQTRHNSRAISDANLLSGAVLASIPDAEEVTGIDYDAAWSVYTDTWTNYTATWE